MFNVIVASRRRVVRWTPLFVLAALGGCVTRTLPPYPAHEHGQVLWNIVHDRCVPDQLAYGRPAPCVEVQPSDEQGGYAVLKDLVGVAQHLLIPTDKITGMEDPRLLDPATPDYFAEAWGARRYVEDRLGGQVPRDQIIVAVNSAYGRSQDQLHLHIDCVSFPVRVALETAATRIGPRGNSVATLAGRAYRVMRVNGGDPSRVRPFTRLATQIASARGEMGAWTLALVATSPQDRAGFFLLAHRADPAHGDPGESETLIDHDCKDQRLGIADRQRG